MWVGRSCVNKYAVSVLFLLLRCLLGCTTLLAKALYPTPVVDVDYEALDTLVYQATCRVMGLPPNAPSAAVRWELRLMPSKLYAHQHALRWACRFAHYSWFYDYAVRRHRQETAMQLPAPSRRHYQLAL
jgi:hypothetical protein